MPHLDQPFEAFLERGGHVDDQTVNAEVDPGLRALRYRWEGDGDEQLFRIAVQSSARAGVRLRRARPASIGRVRRCRLRHAPPARPSSVRTPRPRSVGLGRVGGIRSPEILSPTRPDARPRSCARLLDAVPDRRPRHGSTRPARLHKWCPRRAPAPNPNMRRPPLTCCNVAAITPNVPGSRLAMLRTSGPTVIRGTSAASADRIVQHSSTDGSPCTDPARWSFNHTPSSPAPSTATAPASTFGHPTPKVSNRTSMRTLPTYAGWTDWSDPTTVEQTIRSGERRRCGTQSDLMGAGLRWQRLDRMRLRCSSPLGPVNWRVTLVPQRRGW